MKTYRLQSRTSSIVRVVLMAAGCAVAAAVCWARDGQCGSDWVGGVVWGIPTSLVALMLLTRPYAADLRGNGVLALRSLVRTTTVRVADIERVVVVLPGWPGYRGVGVTLVLAGRRRVHEAVGEARVIDELLWDLHALNRSLDICTPDVWGRPRSDPMAVFALHRLALGRTARRPRA